MKKLISSIAAIAAAAVIAMGSGYVNAPAKTRTFAAGENPQPFCPPFCGGDQNPDGR